MREAITKPFAWLMLWLYEFTSNYGLAIILFALAVNIILSPFMAKSKKSMMRQARLQPRIQELQKRHEGNQQKLQQEMQKLYREEHVNPMSGCLWTLIPFPILIALYSVIRQPLTRMMFVAEEVVTILQDYFVEKGLYVIPEKVNQYLEIQMSDLAHSNWNAVIADLGDKVEGLVNLDFSFLGLNLGNKPQWNFFMNTNWQEPSVWLPALGLFLIPFLSAFFSWLSMKVSNSANPPADAQAQSSTKTMGLVMPLMSIYICFIMPGAMGIYWIANSVFGMLRDLILTKIFKKQFEKEDAVRNAERQAREQELEAKRQETERLRAEGKTTQNTNTSKKKIQASEKQRSDERKAAIERAEREARREQLGIKPTEKPASQVGNRRYARGRAYVEDRFANPEAAEEATLAAAAASEGAASIDESVEDDVLFAVEETVETEEESVETVEAQESAESEE